MTAEEASTAASSLEDTQTGGKMASRGSKYLFIYLVTGLLDNIRHCCPVDGPSQTP
jgi:hypothetical protein